MPLTLASAEVVAEHFWDNAEHRHCLDVLLWLGYSNRLAQFIATETYSRLSPYTRDTLTNLFYAMDNDPANINPEAL